LIKTIKLEDSNEKRIKKGKKKMKILSYICVVDVVKPRKFEKFQYEPAVNS
jgi:hypothetical protein